MTLVFSSSFDKQLSLANW